MIIWQLMNRFRIAKYEGCAMSISTSFDTRQEAEAHRDSCGVKEANTQVFEVDNNGRAAILLATNRP
jgi:hypothetical protein